MKIALVTEELAHGAGSGGIGGAFHELALLLGRGGHTVDVFYVPAHASQARLADLQGYYAAHDIEIRPVPVDDYVWSGSHPESRSYAVFAHLRQVGRYDIVHFHDYKGLGHFCMAAKRQGLAFPSTRFVVQVHGPTRWTLEANGHDFTHEDQLKIDFLERGSIAGADMVVSPSRYMLDWLARHGWRTPEGGTHVIQNACAKLRGVRPPAPLTTAASLLGTTPGRANEVVLFARHEERKGIVEFCKALDLLADELAEANTQVTFLGPLGTVNGEPSMSWLANRARTWRFPIAVLPDLDRHAAAAYLMGNPRSLVVVPSPVENSPYTVLEAIVLGKPLLTSSEGGAPELLDAASAKRMTCRITGPTLAVAIRRCLAKPLCVPRAANGCEETERLWLALHSAAPAEAPRPRVVRTPSAAPTVTVAITHFERPGKLYDALLSIARQTYQEIDVVVVDDGSATQATQDALQQLQPLFDRLGVKLVRQPNLYLGAARNRAARETTSDYLLFLDDDDLAFPTLVATLVQAAERTRADVMGCLNLFMEEHRRAEAHPFPDRFPQKVSYVPLGGPLALAPLANVMGSATALIRRTAFERLGGYTEQHGVGHEDYEFYVRALQAGATVEVCPVPLYLYEVGRPSMITSTSQQKNFRRVAAAIDTRSCPEAWADLVSLAAGRRAVEHTDNLQQYLRRSHPHSALLEALVNLPPASAAYAARAAELAQALGSYTLAGALALLAQRREAAAGLEPAAAPCRVEPAARSAPALEPMRDADIMAALVDLELGRVAEAAGLFRLSVERHRRMTAEQRRFLVALAAAPASTPSDLGPVVDALKRLTVPSSIDPALAPVLFRLLLRAGAADLTLQIVESALREDYSAYAAAYPDVQTTLEGKLEGTLQHYVTHGASEGRDGFGATARLSSVLEEELGVETPLAGLRDVVTALSNAVAAG